MIKLKAIRRARVAEKVKYSATSSLDIYFNGSSNSLTTLPGLGSDIKVIGTNWLYNGSSNLAGSSYPVSIFRGLINKTFNIFGGYQSGLVFWATDRNNWWGATIDVENSQSYDTLCGSYTCVTTACSYYGCGRYGTGCCAYYCAQTACASYYTANYRHNGSLKVWRNIAGSISNISNTIWSYTQLAQIQVSFNNGVATITGHNTSGTSVVSTTVSGGSGSFYGLLGGPITNSSYASTPYVSRLTLN